MINQRIFFIGILPLIVIQLILIIVALWQIKTKGVRNLSPILWVVIVVCINLIGPVLYLTIGRGTNDRDS